MKQNSLHSLILIIMCAPRRSVLNRLNEVLIDDDSSNSEGEKESENDSKTIQTYAEVIGTLKYLQQFARNNYQVFEQLKNLNF